MKLLFVAEKNILTQNMILQENAEGTMKRSYIGHVMATLPRVYTVM